MSPSDVMDQNLTLLHCFSHNCGAAITQLFTDNYFFFLLASLGYIILWPQLPYASHWPLFGSSMQAVQAVVLKALSIAEVFRSAQNVE